MTTNSNYLKTTNTYKYMMKWKDNKKTNSCENDIHKINIIGYE
jgi:hypothetical protein